MLFCECPKLRDLKKNYTDPVQSAKTTTILKNCLLPPSVFLDNGNMASWTGGVSASLKGSGTMESMESSFELSILDSTIDLDATAAYLAAKS